MPPAAPRSPIEGFAGDAKASAAVECGVVLGVIALIVAIVALVLNQDVSALLNDIGVFLARFQLPL